MHPKDLSKIAFHLKTAQMILAATTIGGVNILILQEIWKGETLKINVERSFILLLITASIIQWIGGRKISEIVDALFPTTMMLLIIGVMFTFLKGFLDFSIPIYEINDPQWNPSPFMINIDAFYKTILKMIEFIPMTIFGIVTLIESISACKFFGSTIIQRFQSIQKHP